jgi:hypothetical protein
MAPKALSKRPPLEEMRRRGDFCKKKIRVSAGPGPSQQSALKCTISCAGVPLGVRQGLRGATQERCARCVLEWCARGP